MTELGVHVDLDGRTRPVGRAWFVFGRRRLSTSFGYYPSYLADPAGYDLEPDLVRQSGQQQLDGLPGAFQDAAPDRWGRNLIDRQRRALQRHSDRRLPDTTEVDYLVGVSDLTRQGALRFTAADGAYLDPGDAVPKLVSLPQLLHAADQVSRGDDDLEPVKVLLDAGTASLGGARPKASVRGDDGALLIAKFGHPGDEWDVVGWEYVALRLAERAGLATPRHELVRLGGRSVLLLHRFDRRGGARVGYVSAMTLLGAADGDERDYLDIADAVTRYGARVSADLDELFRRIVFSVALHNTDDHLRNHGFLHARGGWALSPLFDVNPSPEPRRRRVTGIVGADTVDQEPDALVTMGTACRLSPEQTRTVITQVCDVVSGWRAAAADAGLSGNEISRFEPVLTERLATLTG